MMKLIVAAAILTGCTARKIATATKYKVVLDASPTFVAGGDGKGHIVAWQWKQIEGSKAIIENSHSAKASAIVPIGDFYFSLRTTDNLNKSDTAILKVTVK